MQVVDEKKLRRWRRRAIGTWVGRAALLFMACATMFVAAATDDTDNIALSRNEVVGTGENRVWRGTFWNHTDSLYTDLDAVLLFLDSEGKPVGQARGAARRLDPGEVFHLEARLSPQATRMQVYQLRWAREGGERIALGPYRAWPFGYVMDEECGDLRLKIGSCAPQREID